MIFNCESLAGTQNTLTTTSGNQSSPSLNVKVAWMKAPFYYLRALIVFLAWREN